MSGGTCATCGLPGHCYGSTDTEHEPQAIGCVNMLRGEVERLSAALRAIHGMVETADHLGPACTLSVESIARHALR